MSHQPVSVGDRAEAARFRHDLLGRLGLHTDASPKDVEAAHNVLVEFLELAPHKANSWAAARTADMDEAFALLSGPEQGLISASQRASRAQSRLDQTSESQGTAPATPAPASPTTRKQRRTQILGATGGVLVIGVVSLVFQMGKTSDVPGITGTATSQQSPAPSGGAAAVTVDKTKVATLMTKISANPKDVASLQGLGDLYYAASDYKNAIAWEQKTLGVDPKNQAALLALGAGQFNVGNEIEAKKQWLVAERLYPRSAEVHYDLGFLYFSQKPPDTANMTAEWNKVIAIDPNSAIAKAVATHLKSSTPSPGAK
jgi:tetratricopeptide (TPR) repeat protein